MSVHWLECLAPLSIQDPARLLEGALASRGLWVVSRRLVPSGEAYVAGTLRWAHRRRGGASFVCASDIDLGLGREWWDALSTLTDGFVIGYEQWEYRDLFDFRMVLSGCVVEQSGIPGWRPGVPDARARWKERCGLLMDADAGFAEDSELLCEEEWRITRESASGAPAARRGGRALLSNVEAGRFREIAAGDLGGWRYRPWTSAVGVPALDLRHPAGLDEE